MSQEVRKAHFRLQFFLLFQGEHFMKEFSFNSTFFTSASGSDRKE